MDLMTANQEMRNITEQTLEEVFASNDLRGDFIILDVGKDNFLQAAGEDEGTYVLEIKLEGQQFQAVGELTKQEVKTAFLAYFRGEMDWRSKLDWKKLEPKKGCFKKTVILFLVFFGSIWLLLSAVGLP
jgi:hypothetical protein